MTLPRRRRLPWPPGTHRHGRIGAWGVPRSQSSSIFLQQMSVRPLASEPSGGCLTTERRSGRSVLPTALAVEVRRPRRQRHSIEVRPAGRSAQDAAVVAQRVAAAEIADRGRPSSRMQMTLPLRATDRTGEPHRGQRASTAFATVVPCPAPFPRPGGPAHLIRRPAVQKVSGRRRRVTSLPPSRRKARRFSVLTSSLDARRDGARDTESGGATSLGITNAACAAVGGRIALGNERRPGGDPPA